MDQTCTLFMYACGVWCGHVSRCAPAARVRSSSTDARPAAARRRNVTRATRARDGRGCRRIRAVRRSQSHGTRARVAWRHALSPVCINRRRRGSAPTPQACVRCPGRGGRRDCGVSPRTHAAARHAGAVGPRPIRRRRVRSVDRTLTVGVVRSGPPRVARVDHGVDGAPRPHPDRRVRDAGRGAAATARPSATAAFEVSNMSRAGRLARAGRGTARSARPVLTFLSGSRKSRTRNPYWVLRIEPVSRGAGR